MGAFLLGLGVKVLYGILEANLLRDSRVGLPKGKGLKSGL